MHEVSCYICRCLQPVCCDHISSVINLSGGELRGRCSLHWFPGFLCGNSRFAINISQKQEGERLMFLLSGHLAGEEEGARVHMCVCVSLVKIQAINKLITAVILQK